MNESSVYKYKLAIISDLHLSEGWDENGYLSRNEDFFFDQNFKRFLEYLSGEAKREGFFYRLIINGDFVDFLQFTTVPKEDLIKGEAITKRERKLGLGTSEIKTLWKLDRLINGHEVFFTALADFFKEGNEVYIISGNHDIEWVILSVQDALKTRLSNFHPSSNIKDRIKFLPWFYYDSILSVFIEHGSQYDEINSFDYFLWPYRQDGTIALPTGSFFVRYLFNKVEEDYPFADNMKPLTKFLLWARFGFRKPSQFPRFLKFFLWDICKKTKRMDKNWAQELEKRQEKETEKLSKTSDIDKKNLSKLEKYWVPSAIHNKNYLALIWSFKNNSKLDKYYYRERAKVIQEILRARYIVFGHTHEADLAMLSETQGEKNEYINSGTWTKSFAANFEEVLLKSENEFVYVQIGYDPVKKDVKVDLLRWNDSTREGERVRLFKELKRK